LYFLPAVLAGYRAAFPQFDCRLTVGPAADLEDRVVRNELDMAVVAGPRPQGELRALELAPDPFVLIAPPGRSAPARFTGPALAAEEWIVREDGSDARRQTLAWLERVWRREAAVPGVPLSESDEADLALDLAVRDVAAAEEILATQLTRFANPDRRARFAFVMPAAARDASVRARFFESLKDVDNRRREAWVLEAARLIHHPLRAAESAALVRPALALLWEIQRTGDIFFPKRWADATLSGHQSEAVARDVRAFIDGLPAGYPPRLRWVLLASADPLFRAARGGGGA